MEDKAKILELKAGLLILENSIDQYRRKVKKLGNDIEDAENDLRRVKKINNLFGNKIAKTKKHNKKLEAISNLRCIQGIVRRNNEIVQGKKYSRTISHIDEAISKYKEDISEFEDKRRKYKKKINSLEDQITNIRDEIRMLQS